MYPSKGGLGRLHRQSWSTKRTHTVGQAPTCRAKKHKHERAAWRVSLPPPHPLAPFSNRSGYTRGAHGSSTLTVICARISRCSCSVCACKHNWRQRGTNRGWGQGEKLHPPGIGSRGNASSPKGSLDTHTYWKPEAIVHEPKDVSQPK